MKYFFALIAGFLVTTSLPAQTRAVHGKLIIRGRKSFYGSNEALYVVDGVVVNSIDWISPCEVKSINILKDSSAAAYGSRGANGVVVIDLFRGTMTGN